MTPMTWLTLLALWVMFFWLYRDYRLDYFRQTLFALRDELFNHAMEGRVSFEDRAYGMLRSMINGSIQYGHQTGLLNLMFSHFFTRRDSMVERFASDFEQAWTLALSELPLDMQKKLRYLRFRVHLAVVEQVVFTSFVLTITFLTLVVLVLLSLLRGAIMNQMEKWLSNDRYRQFWSRLDWRSSINS